jgi:hypothetical protein
MPQVFRLAAGEGQRPSPERISVLRHVESHQRGDRRMVKVADLNHEKTFGSSKNPKGSSIERISVLRHDSGTPAHPFQSKNAEFGEDLFSAFF